MFSHFLTYFKRDSHFSSYLLINIITSIIVYLFFPFQIKITYGITDSIFKKLKRSSTKLSLFFHLSLNNQIGIFLMHFPGSYFFYISMKFYNSEKLKSCPSIIFFAIYFYRCLIYPFFRHFYSTPIPIRSILVVGILSANHGFLLARSISFIQVVNPIKDYFFASIIFLLFFFLIVHDWIICRSRPNVSDNYFQSTNVLLFKKVTCPQYGLQFLIWLLYGYFLHSFKGFLSYIFWMMTLLLKRADIIHNFFILNHIEKSHEKKPCLLLLNYSPTPSILF